jgi:hypothetical protein
MPFIGVAGGRGRKGGSEVESVWKRETGGERGPKCGGRRLALARE